MSSFQEYKIDVDLVENHKISNPISWFYSYIDSKTRTTTLKVNKAIKRAL